MSVNHKKRPSFQINYQSKLRQMSSNYQKIKSLVFNTENSISIRVLKFTPKTRNTARKILKFFVVNF